MEGARGVGHRNSHSPRSSYLHPYSVRAWHVTDRAGPFPVAVDEGANTVIVSYAYPKNGQIPNFKIAEASAADILPDV
ncbi:hypothetical protein EVAR_10020_1 [Eumeta japonica]|uniref:Uncharacterized protein n=1 Tax=Eumeta variegata TaxID=151549 RepID=A0A4C1TR28_EUMVA|nr:hypothetical protein EVAR_10020_1 [Eumeta japonica]